MNPTKSVFTTLFGTASFLTLVALDAQAQQDAPAQVAQAAPDDIPEQVLVTGSLIRGTVAVGVPVTNLSPQDFRTTGALTTSDLFRTIPQFNVIPGPVATQGANTERGTRVNLRQLDTGIAPKSLMMIDGVRYPPQGDGLCQIDPSIIPTAGIERIDLLLDGASATYGSDAIGGVINIILKRNYDGAVSEVGFKTGRGGGNQYLASQLWGRTWDGGGIVLAYQWFDNSASRGSFAPNRLTYNFTPFGLDNRNPLGSSIPGTISTGLPSSPDSTNYPAAIGNNCTNCFAIPTGAGVPFSSGALGTGPGPRTSSQAASVSPTIAWNGTTFVALNGTGAAGFGANGTANEFNPYIITDYSAPVQFNGATMTVDQRLTRNISFYGEGIYSNRRAEIVGNATGNQLTVQVPTWNPYYPSGPLANSGLAGCPTAGAQAATCVPTNLRVSYHFSVELPSITSAYAQAQRYLGGLNIDLPHDWAGQLYYSMTRDSESFRTFGTVNKAAVSAALGWTMPVSAASGTTPAIATWTKPATVPYLNLFCDPRTITCNSPTTEGYINNYSGTTGIYWINEKGIKADGPLFDLPGGTVKAAIGANYTSYTYNISNAAQSNNSTIVGLQNDPEHRQVWSVFAQLNVPIIGETNALPGVRKLELESSWRHDQYSDVGGTSNPKLAFNWTVSDDLGLTIRGSWGTSFRAPNFGEFSPISNANWGGFGLSQAPGAAQFTNTNPINISCDANGTPAAGSGAAKLFAAGVFGCNSQPAGLSLNGSSGPVVNSGWRQFFNVSQQTLEPESSMNWSAGFDFAPTTFLRGLDIQATWYSVKITGVLTNFGAPTTNRFNDPALGFAYVTPEDLRDPVTGAQLCAGMNLTPQNCPQFEDMVARALSQPTNTVPIAATPFIYWLNDGGSMNAGWQKLTGIDWNVSYDWDMGDLGAWNAGFTGTYYIQHKTQSVPGGPITDVRYNVDLAPVGGVQQLGVELLPRFKYRTRLGWSNGPWSLIAFMDYASHFYHQQTAPPNVNNQCLVAGGTVGGGSLPCLLNNYTNIVPSYYTFDLSGSYDTGDIPASDYLKNVSIQLVVQNVFDKHSPFEYRISTGGGGQPAAFDVLKSIYGRSIQVRVVKTW